MAWMAELLCHRAFPHVQQQRWAQRHPCHRLPLWVTCGRRPGKSFFDVGAALVGCGHVSGLLMRQVWPLALMLCADQVPIANMHSSMR
jgi:hypothetical protein